MFDIIQYYGQEILLSASFFPQWKSLIFEVLLKSKIMWGSRNINRQKVRKPGYELSTDVSYVDIGPQLPNLLSMEGE